jgi:hypothetical protein
MSLRRFPQGQTAFLQKKAQDFMGERCVEPPRKNVMHITL